MSNGYVWTNDYEKLNAEQRLAVDTLDGPVLVVAGPGTGKTQLLSLRVANLLEQRDIQPENICCLTFTDAAAQAMVSRLAGFIGSAAYAVQVSTFHGFADLLRNHYAEFFERSAFERKISTLAAKRLINQLLAELSITNPLYQKAFGAVYNSYAEVAGFIDSMERSGLKATELRAIIEQNRGFFAFAEEQGALLELLDAGIPGSRTEKIAYVERVREEVGRMLASLPLALSAPVLELPGSYRPYASYLAHCFNGRELMEDTGKTIKTSGLQEVKKQLFDGKPLRFKDARTNERMASALEVFERYRAHLHRHGLYDFQDMINDAIVAIEQHPSFQQALQERYRYLLIDEFQDTNGSQMRLVQLLTQGKAQPNILAVGDDDQAIMRFQGASVEYLNQFEQHYPGTKRIVLGTNYRSTPALVALGQEVAGLIERRSPASATEKNLRAFKGADVSQAIVATSYDTAAIQYHQVAHEISKRISEGFVEGAEKPAQAIAVIASQHSNLRALIPYLEQAGVAFNYRVRNTVEEVASLQTFLALLRFTQHAAAGNLACADVWVPQIAAAPELAAVFHLSNKEWLTFALATRRKSWLEALCASEHEGFKELYNWLAHLARQASCLPIRPMLFELARPLIQHYQGLSEERLYEALEFNCGIKALVDFAEAELGQQAERADSVEFAAQGEPVELVAPSAAPSRLANLGALLDSAAALKVDIDVTVPVGKTNAITLTTAHSSKGLEFDLVYLLDADDATWHQRGKSSSVVTGNLLFGTSKDDDDHRRLLFVALTRAKTELRMVQTGQHIARELLGVVGPHTAEVPSGLPGELPARPLAEGQQPVPAPEGQQPAKPLVELRVAKPSLAELADVAQTSWLDTYLPAQQDVYEAARQALAGRRLSVSLLNDFVTYPGEEGLSGKAFVQRQVLGLPQAPRISTEFGTLVHSFFQDYVQKACHSGTVHESGTAHDKETACDSKTACELLAQARRRVSQLDFEPAEVVQYQQFFDLMVEHFLPRLDALLGESKSEPQCEALAERWLEAWVDDVPLGGKVDLMLCNQALRTVRVYDYKTGKFNPDSLDERYLRQLRFYRLLIENVPEYHGWHVEGGADLYVVPQREPGGAYQLANAPFTAVPDQDVEHLRRLVVAVWRRLEEGRFDTSAFLTSEHYGSLCKASVYKTSSDSHQKGDPKPPGSAELQACYEQWLIEGCEQDASSNHARC